MANGMMNDNIPDQPATGGAAEQFEGLSESLFEILWRRRWTVLLASVVALAGGFCYIQRATPLFKSTSRVYVEQSTPKIFRDMDEGMLSRSTNYLYTQAELLDSTPILAEAMKTGELDRLKTFVHASNKTMALRKGLETAVGKKDELLSVSFKSPYPEEAAHIVNTVVDAYVTFHGQRKRNTSGELLKILTQEKTTRDKELSEKLQAMMDFKQKNEGLALGTGENNNVILQNLARLSAVLTEAQLATVESKSFYAVAQKMEADPVGLRQFVEAQRTRNVYVSTDEATALRSEFLRLQRDRADSLNQLKPDAPAIVAQDADIERVQKQIIDLDKEFAKSQLAVAEQEYQANQEKEQELAKYFEQQRQDAVQLNNQVAQYTVLQSGYEQTKKLCDILDDRIKELSVIEETGALNITVLETAEPASAPCEPQKAKAMAMALALGLFAGTGLALLREWKDQRLRSTEEISALLGLPVLGAIPSVSSLKHGSEVLDQRTQLDSNSHEAEAFRTLRTAVFFGVPKDEARKILVTSPAPGEGKSTVACNLGIAIAQAGQKVLIIDADLRKPMQHRIFGLDRQAKGLSAVLAGQMSLEDAIEHTAVENLDVLTSGPDVPNPAEILNSESFSRLLEKVAAAYDRVLIDSPPVTAVTDPLILAAQTDVTILVLQAEVSTRRVSMQARAALASVDARVLGVAVNNVLHRKGRYGYYSGYGYYYYYYGHDGKEKRKKSSPASEDRPPTPAVVSSSEGGNGADREPVEGGPNVATRLAGLWRGRGQRAKRDNK
jgi:capsular exopolysaccharide synthesis family protein